jgi:PAS domain S-box-containing protein
MESILKIFASLTEAVLVIDSRSRTISAVNPATERVFGYSEKELIGRNPAFLHLGKAAYEEFAAAVSAALDSAGRYFGQFRMRRKDGTVFYSEHTITELRDDSGHRTGTVSVVRDITERILAEEALRKTQDELEQRVEARTRELTKANEQLRLEIEERKLAEEALRQREECLAEAQRIAHLGSWDWNIVSNQLFWSDEVYRIFGLSPQQFSATYEAFLKRVHSEDRQAVKDAVNQSLADPTIKYSIQHRIQMPDESIRTVHERAEVEFDTGGMPVRMIGTVQDITEQKLIEAEARRLRSDLAHRDRVGTIGALTGAIAHEINQPLAAILSNAQAALRFLDHERPDLAEVREALYDIVSDDKRAATVIHRLRGMLKKKETVREIFDLNGVIAEVIQLIGSEIVLRRAKLTEDLQTSLPHVLGDPVQIQQVVLNLLINALDAIKDRPLKKRSVTITTEVDGSQWIVTSVVDEGPGIARDTAESIFEPFYTTKPDGIGIGLSICRSIVEAHGGRVWAENRLEGGAQISFRLPVKESSHERTT